MPIITVNVPGLAGPYPHTPVRAPGSARRTSHIDVVHGAEQEGETIITGVARDIVTPADGGPPVTAQVALRLVVADLGSVIVDIRTDPDEPALRSLIGSGAIAGFRRAAALALARGPGRSSLLHRLLDDSPLAFMVSSHALMQDDRPRVNPERPAARSGPRTANLCAGWQEGGLLLGFLDDGGTLPHSLGPLAPRLALASDPLAWHDRPELPPRGARRTRRLDVVPAGQGRAVRLDAHFRDSYGDLDGQERSLHEYTVEAEVDPEAGVVRSATAVPRALPWTECPQAAGSASRLVGLKLDDLPELVRVEFTGITTCTHLNDTLRSLADGSDLLAQVRR